jgi:hypothetical protein
MGLEIIILNEVTEVQKDKHESGVIAHTCNPRNSGRGDWEDSVLRPGCKKL